jgi:hypothetical protein
MKEVNGVERGVQPLNMVDKSISPLQTHFRPVFVSRQSGQALYWLLRISVLKQANKQQRDQLSCHLPDGERER